jgi:hypothetical protein
MRIASHCQDRALLLLQVAQECPQFEEQAEFLASEWLLIAALRIDLERSSQVDKTRERHSPFATADEIIQGN